MSLTITDLTVCLNVTTTLSHRVKTQSLWWLQRKLTQVSVDTCSKIRFPRASPHFPTIITSPQSLATLRFVAVEIWYKWVWIKETLNNACPVPKKKELSRQQANRVMGDDWGSYEIWACNIWNPKSARNFSLTNINIVCFQFVFCYFLLAK